MNLALLSRAPTVRVPPFWRSSPRLLLGALVLAVVILAAMLVIDFWSIREARLLPPALVARFAFVTDFGKSGWFLWPIGLLLVAMAFLPEARLPRSAQAVFAAIAVRLSYLFAAIAVPGLVVAIVKRLIGRARPFVEDGSVFVFRPFGWSAAYASFPSGHATTAFSVLIAFGALWPDLRPVLWIYALLICVSRVIVVAHHPSDVIAGAVFGAAGALLVRDWYAARRLIFSVRADGRVVAKPGPHLRRVRRLVGQVFVTTAAAR